MKILIVDDSAFMRRMIMNIIREKGDYEIIEASDGNEAVKKFEKKKPDIIFLDIIMPNKDGVEALKEIKSIDKNAKVVMCTSIGGQEKVVSDAIQAGAYDVITKPFKTDEITNVIENIENQ